MSNDTISRVVRIVPGIMLITAVGSWEYSYYQLLRITVCSAAIYLVWYFANLKIQWLIWAFLAAAILFNPIAPIYLDRSTWQLIDILFGLLFIGSLGVTTKYIEK